MLYEQGAAEHKYGDKASTDYIRAFNNNILDGKKQIEEAKFDYNFYQANISTSQDKSEPGHYKICLETYIPGPVWHPASFFEENEYMILSGDEEHLSLYSPHEDVTVYLDTAGNWLDRACKVTLEKEGIAENQLSREEEEIRKLFYCL